MASSLDYYRHLLESTALNPPLSDGDGDSLDNDIQLDSGTNALLLEVTEDEYIKMLSALLNGARQTYPLDYIAVVYPLIKAGKLDICAQILACIESTPAIQNLIAGLSLGTPVEETTPENEIILGTEVITSQAGCDNDKIFGMTTGVTDLWNDLSVDLIEIIQDVPALFGRIGDIIEAIPGVGILPYDDILQFVESWMDDIATAYDASYTVALRNEIRCHLFCMASANCELTMEQMRDYFEDELGETLDFDNWGEFFISLLALNLVGEATVWGVHLLISQILVFGSSIFRNDTDLITSLINAMFNDDDSDWESVCTDCVWTETFSGTQGDPETDGWDGVWGQWDAVNEWWDEEWAGGQSDYSMLDFFIPAGKEGRIIEFKYNYALQTYHQRTQQIGMKDDLGAEIEVVSVPKTGVHSGTFTLVDEHAFFEGYRLFCFVNVGNIGQPHYARITSITVRGTGDNPFT